MTLIWNISQLKRLKWLYFLSMAKSHCGELWKDISDQDDGKIKIELLNMLRTSSATLRIPPLWNSSTWVPRRPRNITLLRPRFRRESHQWNIVCSSVEFFNLSSKTSTQDYTDLTLIQTCISPCYIVPYTYYLYKYALQTLKYISYSTNFSWALNLERFRVGNYFSISRS